MKEKGLIIIAAILLGGWLGNKVKIPSGYLVGGMIFGLLAKGFAGGNLASGSALSAISQIMVAYVVVSNSDVQMIKRHPEVIPVALGYIIALVVICLGLSFILNKVFHIDLKTAIYATAPGGLSGMALSATDAGAETPISMIFHLFRMTVVLLATPLLATFFAK
ncbi:MAG: putative ammonia monooxygenase-like protein [Spirochaetes bacterium]|nr:MAG: putative ammonia monooxygenase-like protein [Spirochaetota bacterium]